ncbi:hypothetical protein AAHA92_25185 [Salvia divinorum]|uniref:Reverse transcriptase Ty1/copia-type domain-containing protein n=1 Tax=Salvia divinorum TaxID=28513 RepID=A0ABD1G9T4_SALDI
MHEMSLIMEQTSGNDTSTDDDVLRNSTDDQNETQVMPSIARERPKRTTRLPQRFSDYEMAYFALNVAECMEYDEPATYKEAMEGDECEKWLDAMREEMDSLMRNRTWILTERSSSQKLVGCKWIFKKKVKVSDQNRIRYKARLVAKGYLQKEGVDFNEIFSPVVKHSSIRILLSVVAQRNWELHQLDVKTTFLHGDLIETIYMEQPKGFIVSGQEEKVCLLKKSLYGLKQSSRQWYIKFDAHLSSIGFIKSAYDNCVYIKSDEEKEVAYLVLYVDDMLVAAADMNEINSVKHELQREFEMKDLGEAKRILEMDIIRNRNEDEIKLVQTDYFGKLIKKFQMQDSKVVSVPLAQHFKLSMQQIPKIEQEKSEMLKIPYANIIGSIMYCVICTRPDLAHGVSVTSRYMKEYGREHWSTLKWMLRYIKGSRDIGILFKRQEVEDDNPLIGYCDSDYASNIDSRKSQTCYIFKLHGAAISWKSTLQSVVALSTIEAEYIALTEALKEGVWLRGILNDFGVKQMVVRVLCDNTGAICLAKHQVFHERGKHIDVRLYFIRDQIEKGDVEVLKVGTEDNAADALTKALPVSKLKHCLRLVNVIAQ